MWFDLKGNLEVSAGEYIFEITCDRREIYFRLPSEFKPNSVANLSWASYKNFIREAADNFAKHKLTIYVYQDEDLLVVIGDKAKSVSYTHLTLPTNREV